MKQGGTVSYASLRTPIGQVHIAVTARGLAGVGLGGPLSIFLHAVARRTRGSPRRDPEGVAPYAAQIQGYLKGRRTRLRMRVDWHGISPFQRSVLLAARGIPVGRTATYGEIARKLRRAGAARAVGQALAANPFPLVFPCHRVVAASGGLGGYSAPQGIALKARLLRLERERIRSSGAAPAPLRPGGGQSAIQQAR